MTRLSETVEYRKAFALVELAEAEESADNVAERLKRARQSATAAQALVQYLEQEKRKADENLKLARQNYEALAEAANA